MNRNTESNLLHMLRLMTEPERVSFRTELGLDEAANDGDVVNALGGLPRYEYVRMLLRASDSTLVMLQEVFDALDSFGLTTRTTGCVFVLANPANPEERTELAFSQQTVSTVCSWSLRDNWKRCSASLDSLYSTWRNFRTFWRHLLDEAETQTSRRLDVVRSAVGGRTVYHERDHTDQNAQRVLLHFLDRARQLADRLDEIPSEQRPQELANISRDVRDLEKTIGHCMGGSHQLRHTRRRPPEPPTERTILQYVSRQSARNFDKFIEDVYLLSDLIRGHDLADMLQINLWSSRPQLYEVWVMVTILRWLDKRGYNIEFLKTNTDVQDASFRWDLSYSKDSNPCAVVRDQQAGIERFMFYQLYRTTGDMPDISLLEGSSPSSPPVWSVDPKHSERGAYSLADYRKTAERYRDSFGAGLSLVVEYFDRPRLGHDNPIVFDTRAKMVRGCRPVAPGLQLLLDEIACFHPAKKQALVCIDFSSSFSAKRNGAINRLRQQIGSRSDSSVASECICFAGNTAIFGNFNEWQDGATNDLLKPNGLIDGTSSEPLIQAIVEFAKATPVAEVFLITDGQFDVPIEDVVERIRTEGNALVSVVD